MPVVSRALSALALLAVVLTSACAGVQQGAHRMAPAAEAPSLEARAALRYVALARRVARAEGDRIWPGYALDERPVLLFSRDGEAYLVGPPFAPAGGAPVGEPAASGELVFRVRLPLGALDPNVVFRRSFEIDGIRAFALRFGDGRVGPVWFRLFVHELFHMDQLDRWEQGAAVPPVCRYPATDVAPLALAAVEQRRLAAGLGADPEDAADALADLAALRARRRGEADGETAARVEQYEERLEGTARYVELAYAVHAGLLAESKADEELASGLLGFALTDLDKWRYYSTGAALGRLLDRAGVGDWKARVVAGATFDTLLAEGLPSDAEARFGRALAAYEDEGLRDRLRASIARRVESEARWLRRYAETPGVPVEIRSFGHAEAYFTNRGPTLVLPDCRKLATGVQEYVDVRFGLRILGPPGTRPPGAAGRPMLMSGSGRTRTLAFRAHEPAVLDVDGRPVDPSAEGRHPFGERLRLEGPSWSVQFDGRGEVTIGPDGGITLELRSE